MTAHEICQEIEKRMRQMGVNTTAHYDAGCELIADAIRAAVAEERRACAEIARRKKEAFDSAAEKCSPSSHDLRRICETKAATAEEIEQQIIDRKDGA